MKRFLKGKYIYTDNVLHYSKMTTPTLELVVRLQIGDDAEITTLSIGHRNINGANNDDAMRSVGESPFIDEHLDAINEACTALAREIVHERLMINVLNDPVLADTPSYSEIANANADDDVTDGDVTDVDQ